MTSVPGPSNVLPEAEAGVGDEQRLAAGADRREGQAAPSQPRDSRPPRQGQLREGIESFPIISPLDGTCRGWVRLDTARLAHTGMAITVDSSSFLCASEARALVDALGQAADRLDSLR
jgi:hypothetical protein